MNRRRWRVRALFAALYLTEGAPIGFLWWFLPGRLRESGVAIGEIAALTAGLGLPWAFKWAWAPALDLLRGPRWGYRQWMAVMQALMVATLLPLAWLDLTADFRLVYALCFAHACAAATQDVAIDALAITTVAPADRGAVNGWMQAGMLLGRAAFGGLAIRFAAGAGLAPVVVSLGAVVAVVGTIAYLRTGEQRPSGVVERGRVARAFRALATRRMGFGLLFAATAGAGFEAFGGLASVFLVDRGLSAAARGDFFAFASVPCMIVGALLGGAASDRWGRRGPCAAFLLLLAGAIGLVAFVAGEPPPVLLPAFGLVYLAIGLFTAASYAFFMDLTRPEAAATQFTSFMAMTNLCEVWSVAAVGPLVEAWGFPFGFGTMAVVSLGALLVLGLPVLGGARSAREESA